MAFEPTIPPPDPLLAETVRATHHRIEASRLRQDLEDLPGPRNRLHQPDAAEATEQMLLRSFGDAGWSAVRQPFDLKTVAATWIRPLARYFPESTGVNILATKPGRRAPQEIVLVGAHHDTLPETPGADDNGAGVVGLLELARLLTATDHERTVVLAAFDYEEVGFHGARQYVQSVPPGSRVLGSVIYETMAFTATEPGSQAIPPGLGALFPAQVARIKQRDAVGDWTAFIYRRSAQRLAVRLAQGLVALEGEHAAMLLRDPIDLPIVGPVLKWAVPPVHNFARSDHKPFWDEGIPSVQITDTANFRNPHYHQPSDTPETVDYDRLAAIIASTAAAVDEAARRLS
jgi:hypothetical protein